MTRSERRRSARGREPAGAVRREGRAAHRPAVAAGRRRRAGCGGRHAGPASRNRDLISGRPPARRPARRSTTSSTSCCSCRRTARSTATSGHCPASAASATRTFGARRSTGSRIRLRGLRRGVSRFGRRGLRPLITERNGHFQPGLDPLDALQQRRFGVTGRGQQQPRADHFE